MQREYETACENLRRARQAGIPMMTGTDSGFAVTPYGEWHAREIEIFVNDLGFTPAAGAARGDRGHRGLHGQAATSVGVLEPGRAADFIAVAGLAAERRRDPAGQDAHPPRAHRRQAHRGARPRGYDPRQVTDLAWTNWNDLYTQERVGELGIKPERRRLALQDSEM